LRPAPKNCPQFGRLASRSEAAYLAQASAEWPLIEDGLVATRASYAATSPLRFGAGEVLRASGLLLLLRRP
jgi:hypothetical protein